MSSAGPPPPRTAMPSSFDDDEDFRNDNRLTKLKRLLLQDPLVPIGCALTVAALLGATRAMKRNDHATANKMFRRRIYAQAFTIVAIVAGSSYFNKDKEERKRAIEDEKARSQREKRDKWLAELDFRDQEDRERRSELESRRARKAAEREAEAEAHAAASTGGSVSEAVKGLLWSNGGEEKNKKDR